MLNDFKKFINKGNVVEIAVGLIMATYFGSIVKSLVDDIIMPPIGIILGGVDFSELKLVLQTALPESTVGAGDGIAEVAINYGKFINTMITFMIVSFAIFLVVKAYNTMKERLERKEAAAEAIATPPAPSNQEVLLAEIRDLLKK